MANLMDPASAWWAKLNHAKVHAGTLGKIVAEYQAAKPISMSAEPGDNEVAYRLHISRPVPLDISLAVGDILHNARSALDALVYGLAVDQVGRRLNEREERACQFPICDSPDAFNAFWTRRTVIETDRLENALHHVQPYYWTEQAKNLGIEAAQDESYEDSSRLSNLWWLNRMNNIDKHRQLAVVAWWPGLTYWGSEEGQAPQDWRYSGRPFADGEIFGYASGGGEDGPNDVITEFNLSLADWPYRGDKDVLATAKGWIDVAIQTMGQIIRDWSAEG